jgi:4-hydroxybenzoate polyprenyltransferase
VPPAVQPFLKLMRMDRPIGTYLILLPGWTGLALAAAPGTLFDPWMAALFGACAWCAGFDCAGLPP